MLIPFVENSFKHLSHFSNGHPNYIKIDASGPGNKFHFSIINTTEGKQVNKLDKEGGIGLANVKRRLELLYPGKHTLSFRETEGMFEVDLMLVIDK
ncbi:MAG: GHKL domain-containing protein [Bacteroidota bacterium]